MASVSTHVLDAAAGGAMAGVTVTLTDATGRVLAEDVTGPDGRLAMLAVDLPAGTYRLRWDTGGSFVAAVTAEVVLPAEGHHHIPLLASPVAATVYRGA